MGSDDEKITKICLSTLIAQFKSKTQVKPDMFYEQMNLIATSGPVSYLNAVLDIYTEKFTACENILVSLELTTSLKVLAELNRKNPVKNEVILQIVMKLFVDKGLQIIKMRGDSSRKVNNSHILYLYDN